MKQVVFLFLFFLSIVVTGQNSKNKTIDLKTGTVAEKFDNVFQKSGKYQQYKVVNRLWLIQLKKQVLDTLKKEKAVINAQRSEISKLKNEVQSLKQKLQTLEDQLKEVSLDKNQIDFFGMKLNKSDYKIMMWSLVGILALLLGFFIYKFKNSNSITLQSKENLALLEEEYNKFRASALEREQLLKRQLLDEQKKHQS